LNRVNLETYPRNFSVRNRSEDEKAGAKCESAGEVRECERSARTIKSAKVAVPRFDLLPVAPLPFDLVAFQRLDGLSQSRSGFDKSGASTN
jgi:hypothetical protein